MSVHPTTKAIAPKEKVCLIGSGNWGSAIATVVGRNCERLPFVENQVNMWVYDEDIVVTDKLVGGLREKHKLSEIINSRHENVKYLPGIRLPPNVVAIPSIQDAVRGATLLVFVLPHQFLFPLLPSIREAAALHLPTCRGISLIKGLDFDSSSKRPILISGAISKAMGNNFPCGVLMGANVANEVAQGQLCESTLACSFAPPLDEVTRLIFHSPQTFRVQHICDVAGAEVCGALKNVIALGAGFLDGLGLGNNTKAALIRVGLHETLQFCNAFFQGVSSDTFLQSCGVADLITTCYSGRHRRCAEAFVKESLQKEADTDEESMINSPYDIGIIASRDARKREACEAVWENIQSSLLNGQKLQGTLCAKEVYAAISSINAIEKYPLLTTIHDIAFAGKPVQEILEGIKDPYSSDLRSLQPSAMQSNL